MIPYSAEKSKDFGAYVIKLSAIFIDNLSNMYNMAELDRIRAENGKNHLPRQIGGR